MSAINDFIAALQDDTNLQEALMNVTDPSEAEKIANDAGFQVSAQEILEAYQANLSELTDEELLACTGGGKSRSVLDPFPKDPKKHHHS